MAWVVFRRIIKAKARVNSQTNPYGICHGQRDTGVLLRLFNFSVSHFTSSTYSFNHHQRYRILAADIVVKQHIKNICLEDAANPVFSLGNGTLLI
jgi:hypothetical protein